MRERVAGALGKRRGGQQMESIVVMEAYTLRRGNHDDDDISPQD